MQFRRFDIKYLQKNSDFFVSQIWGNAPHRKTTRRRVQSWFDNLGYGDLARFSWGYLRRTIGNKGGIFSSSKWAPVNEDEIRKELEEIKKQDIATHFLLESQLKCSINLKFEIWNLSWLLKIANFECICTSFFVCQRSIKMNLRISTIKFPG